MAYRCVGCNNPIPWDGTGIFCYTCKCGGHSFFDEKTLSVSLPASVVIALQVNRNLPHLDYIVGISEFTSRLKDNLIHELESKGATWMKDCEQCQKDGIYQREVEHRAHLEKFAAVREAERIIRDATIK